MYWNDLNSRLKAEYGCKVYKLALSSGCSCPNRDGTLGTGGCIFCSAGGSGDFASPAMESVTAQIEAAKAQVRRKMTGKGAYIAYFQSYTNTYGPVSRLRMCGCRLRDPLAQRARIQPCLRKWSWTKSWAGLSAAI